MAIITLPDALRPLLNQQDWSYLTYDAQQANPITGASRARRLGPPRWGTSLSTHSALQPRDTAALDALLLELDGSVNQLALYDVKYQQPRGTLRGSLTLTADVAQGATSLTLTGGAGQAGNTLLRGDRLQLGSGAQRQVITVMTDQVANGSGNVTISLRPGCRWAQSSGAAVVWSRPTALFRIADASRVELVSRAHGLDQGLTLALIESWDA